MHKFDTVYLGFFFCGSKCLCIHSKLGTFNLIFQLLFYFLWYLKRLLNEYILQLNFLQLKLYPKLSKKSTQQKNPVILSYMHRSPQRPSTHNSKMLSMSVLLAMKSCVCAQGLCAGNWPLNRLRYHGIISIKVQPYIYLINGEVVGVPLKSLTLYLPHKWAGCQSSIGWCGPGWGQWRLPWRRDTCLQWWYRSAPPRIPPLYNRSWTGSCQKMSWKQNKLLTLTQK